MIHRNLATEGDDEVLFVFTIACGALAIYNVFETLFLIYNTFSKYKSLYFWSMIICSIGIFLFAVGFIDLFFRLYENNDGTTNGTIYRPLFVLTIGWYGMVTGFSLVMYSRLSLISVPEHIIKIFRHFLIFNIVFMHFPTSILTFGANINPDDSDWVNGYAVYEKVQITFFFIQEVSLGMAYLHYIRKFSSTGGDFALLANKTVKINVTVIILDLSMLLLEYVNLYSYQIMLKAAVYSIKLKLEFYILNILTTSIHARQKVVTVTPKYKFQSGPGTGSNPSKGSKGSKDNDKFEYGLESSL